MANVKVTSEKRKSPIDEQIKALEEQISKTKYNKKTQGAIGIYKAQIAKLKERKEVRAKSGPKQDGYAVRKTGDGTVILVGFPSVGKSTLLNKLTNANSPVAAYEFTTLTVIPGLLEYRHAKIQILDVPGIVRGAAAGTGRGKEVLSAMRNADMALIIIDVFRPEALKVLQKEIYDAGLRLNIKKPKVNIKKKDKGGVDVSWTVPNTKLDKDIAQKVCREMGLVNAYVVIHEDLDVDRLIDAIEDNKVYLPGLTVLNKIDLIDKDALGELKRQVRPDISISANSDKDFDALKDMIYDKLELMPIFCKEIGKPADMDVPMLMHRGATIEEMCNKLHKDFVMKFKFARVWGASAKFPGQKFMIKHAMKEGDVVELHVK